MLHKFVNQLSETTVSINTSEELNNNWQNFTNFLAKKLC